MLNCIDNSGAAIVECIMVVGQKRHASIGMYFPTPTTCLLPSRPSNNYSTLHRRPNRLRRSKAKRCRCRGNGRCLDRGQGQARADLNGDAAQWLSGVRSDVTAAIANGHGLNVADLVLVAPGSIPTTTSGKIRRAACAQQYRQHEFERLDA